MGDTFLDIKAFQAVPFLKLSGELYSVLIAYCSATLYLTVSLLPKIPPIVLMFA